MTENSEVSDTENQRTREGYRTHAGPFDTEDEERSPENFDVRGCVKNFRDGWYVLELTEVPY